MSKAVNSIAFDGMTLTTSGTQQPRVSVSEQREHGSQQPYDEAVVRSGTNGKRRAPAALPLKKASTPPLRHVRMTVSRMLDLLPAVIMLSRIFSRGAVAVLETAPATRTHSSMRTLQ